jgi:hypothetical protein
MKSSGWFDSSQVLKQLRCIDAPAVSNFRARTGVKTQERVCMRARVCASAAVAAWLFQWREHKVKHRLQDGWCCIWEGCALCLLPRMLLHALPQTLPRAQGSRC